MRILAVHNYYQQRGGEDQCFEDEVNVLQRHGHTVHSHTVHNDSIANQSKVRVALQTIWNREAHREIQALIRSFKPDLMHAMNTFPLLSPSIFFAAKRLRVPVVFEVQNYRLGCAGGVMLRDGQICESCIRWPLPVPAVIHRCYRGSAFGSAVVATHIVSHRLLRTWHRMVDVILCPSQISKTKLVESGLPSAKIRVKPNALDIDPGLGDGPQGFLVFVGRLSPEKGIDTLLDAWQQHADLPRIKIIGDGPLADMVKAAQAKDDRIEFLGHMPISKLLDYVGQADCLVMPSKWYETFGRTTIEAFAKGTPVVGARIGGMAEIIEDGRTGWLFAPGDASDLAAKLRIMMSLHPEQRSTMRSAARQVYLERYTSETNYRNLISIYESVLANES